MPGLLRLGTRDLQLTALDQLQNVGNPRRRKLLQRCADLRGMLAEKGRCVNAELENDLKGLLSVQAKRCEAALEERRTLLEQVCAKNTESLEKRQSKLLDRINRLQSRLEGSAAVVDEAGMTALLHREATAFSGSAYQLINASLDPLVQKMNGELSAEEIDPDSFALPQADNYRELRAEQDEQVTRFRGQLAATQESQWELTRALAAEAGSPEYFQRQRTGPCC